MSTCGQSIYLGHFLPIGFWIERSFGQQNWVFLGSYSQLVVEGVVPDLKHKTPHNVISRPVILKPFSYKQVISHFTFSMSSQLVTMPCSMGYFRVRMPLLL